MRRVVIFLVICAIAIAASAFSVLRSRLNPAPLVPAGQSTLPQMPVPSGGIGNGSYLLFRSTTHDDDYGRLSIVAADDPSGPRAFTSLSCDRVDFEGGLGLCLTRPTTGIVTGTSAVVFNPHFKVLRRVPLTGFPSRARVSPDGRYGAVTTFVTGDSYAATGMYSTRTDIIDMRTGTVLFDLDKLSITKNGAPFQATDFNFWGVTFSNDVRHFYATLGSGGQTYLIKADIATRRASVIASNVECPSLSPDDKEIAFKRRLQGAVVKWRLSVINLTTLKVRPLAETRSIDDQVEWLNNTTIIYGVLKDQAIASLNPFSSATPSLANGAPLVTNTFSVPADGKGTPKLFNTGASSEAVTDR
jgi:hypothetical protein